MGGAAGTIEIGEALSDVFGLNRVDVVVLQASNATAEHGSGMLSELLGRRSPWQPVVGSGNVPSGQAVTSVHSPWFSAGAVNGTGP